MSRQDRGMEKVRYHHSDNRFEQKTLQDHQEGGRIRRCNIHRQFDVNRSGMHSETQTLTLFLNTPAKALQSPVYGDLKSWTMDFRMEAQPGKAWAKRFKMQVDIAYTSCLDN